MSVETVATVAGFLNSSQVEKKLEQQDFSDDYNVSIDSTGSKDDDVSSTSERSSTDSTKQIKCSAVHSMERDMPKFDYSHLVEELRARILEECKTNEGCYSRNDVIKCQQDDWHISRFLLRQKLDVDLAFNMLKKAMRFNHESLMNYIKPEDFPAEFYQIGGLFIYEPDRKGNQLLYVRVKIHKKIPEINAVLQAFLYYNLHRCDELASGKGISMVLDCTGGGLANADMDTLLFLVTTLLNYFPKGFSYFLVHELPWILKPFWYIARAWLPDEYKDLIKFSNSKTIYEYIDKENLPDFMGGTCKKDYRKAPKNCTTLMEASKLWGVEPKVIKQVLQKFKDNLPQETVERINRELEEES